MAATDITVATLHAWRESGEAVTILDVREPWETEICVIAGSLLIPMGQLPERLSEVPDDRPVVVVCHHGVRSTHAAVWMRRQGRSQVINLAGGIDAWARHIEPQMEMY